MPRHILLVEDNQDDEELTRIAFERASIGHPLEVARDGEEALAALQRPDGLLPALVLLDLKLPKIDGLEVLQRMRADPRTRLLPVVVLTSSRAQRDIAESYRLGANSYIRKPVDFDQFVATVQQLGRYWLALNELPLEP
ncbi:MAG TPA: response regulator [Lysobacter sp.]|nr:response regulator [Lysobacter sp.]